MIPAWAHWMVEFVGWWFLIAVVAAGAWVWLKWETESGR